MLLNESINQIFSEHFDIADPDTLKTLVNLDEADRNETLSALTSKLYDNIVDKIDDIDFGTIPLSKGDITKIENYEQMLDCIGVMRQIVEEYKQSPEPLDTILTSIENIKSRTRLWEKAYALNVELPIVLYNTIVLSIVSAVSIMIGTSIEFIKSPDSPDLQASLDRVAYNKSKDNLLFQNLEKFNNCCNKGEIDKVVDQVFTGNAKELTGTTMGAVGAIAFIALAKNIIPMLQELVFFAYHTKQSVSDYFAVQADLLQSNANTLQYRDIEPEKRKKIYSRQTKIADRFRKISNVFAIKTKKAEMDTKKDVKDSQSKKYTYSNVMEPSMEKRAGSLF